MKGPILPPAAGSRYTYPAPAYPHFACRPVKQMAPRPAGGSVYPTLQSMVRRRAVAHQGNAQRSGQRGKRTWHAHRAAKAVPCLWEKRALPLSAHTGSGVSPAAFWVLFRRGKSTSRRSAKGFLHGNGNSSPAGRPLPGSYRSSRTKGMDMHLGPPRPLDSSLQAMVWTLMPLSARIWLVTALRW